MNAQTLSRERAATATFYRLVVFGAVLLNLLVVGMTVMSLSRSRTHLQEDAATETRNLSRLLEQHISSAIDRIDSTLIEVRDAAEMQIASGEVDRDALAALIARHHARQPDVDSLRVTDPRGNVLGGANTPVAVAIADRDYFRRLRDDAGAGLVISSPVLGRISQTWMIVLARRIARPDGSFGGIVLAPVALDHFKEFFSAIDIGRGGTIHLLDDNFRVLARQTTGDEGVAGDDEVVRGLREQVDAGRLIGTFDVASSGGIAPGTISFRKVSDYPLYVVVGLSSDHYLARWRIEAFQLLTLTALFVLTTVVLARMFHQVWRHRIMARERVAQLRLLAMELSTAEERERRAIAQELHDDLGQTLAIAKLKLSALEMSERTGLDDASAQGIKEAEAMIDQASRSVRSLSLQLSPPVLHQFGLVPALEWLADELRRSHGLSVRIHDDGKPKVMGEVVSNTLFRAVRELLINVSRHAKVEAAEVTSVIDDGKLVLTVADAGSGFDTTEVPAPSSSGGYGLFSVRERISFIGGDMQIDSRPGDGTVVVLTLPHEEAS